MPSWAVVGVKPPEPIKGYIQSGVPMEHIWKLLCRGRKRRVVWLKGTHVEGEHVVFFFTVLIKAFKRVQVPCVWVQMRTKCACSLRSNNTASRTTLSQLEVLVKQDRIS